MRETILKTKPIKKTSKLIGFIDTMGSFLIFVAITGAFLTFGPVLFQEAKYQMKQGINGVLNSTGLSENRENIENKNTTKEIIPPNTDFSIVIPKIEASAPVVSDVNPFNEVEFLSALKKGVAHAKWTSFPGREGNTYIFAHSTDAFYNVGRYNAVFYLIGKLEKGDEVYVYYKGDKYVYIVYDKKIVPPEAVEFLNNVKNEDRLTLQTCYPPGTTMRRLVVLAKLLQ